MASGMSAVAAANAQRRVGTMLGPSVSTNGLPGMSRGDEVSAGRKVSYRRGTGEGERMGPDDMFME